METGEAENKSVLNDESELEHFARIVKSFKAYNYFATKRVAKSLHNYHELEIRQRDLVPDFEDNCKKLLSNIEQNTQILQLIVEDVENMFENDARSLTIDEENLDEGDTQLVQNVDRVGTTLKQIMRDWSVEGESERECYKTILNELMNCYKSVSKNDRSEISVLVPGSGLARLAFEIASLGFTCEGNEFSLHMLIASNFILNKCDVKGGHLIYPFVNSWCNNLSMENQLKAIKFPDIQISDYSLSKFSMVAGDFLDVYKEEKTWDCVVTCFFIDTAHNVIDYIERIWHILKPGGYWINLGPLLYHYSDMLGEKSVELNYEQIRNVILKTGFVYLKEQTSMPCRYLDNPNTMLRYSYNCVFFSTQKPSS